MVRSMYSGVAGMKAHQTKMDVIGNNIANVNTYGFKSSRVTFRDMFYQNIRGASAGTANAGGMNPSSIGYGSTVGSVDTLMTTSTLTSTGNPLDAAIMGDGFFQVMDNDGNIFYTKAGMLDIDSNGNLVDTNGYFVLGTSGDPLGKSPGSEKIQFSIPNVTPKGSTGSVTVGGTTFTISASNTTNEGNVSFNFSTDSSMPLGQKSAAIISGSSIVINLNPNETFTSLSDFQTAINDAITVANGGKAHPAGNFTVSMSGSSWPTGGLTGAQIANADEGPNKGEITLPPGTFFGGISMVEVGDTFSQSGSLDFKIVYDNGTNKYSVVAYSGTTDLYSYRIDNPDGLGQANVLMTRIGSNDPSDTITIFLPDWATMTDSTNISGGTGTTADPYTWAPMTGATAVASTPSGNIGLKQLSLKGGTAGGVQSMKDLTGISIGADGVIIATHSEVDGFLTLGRIDLATFDNPNGLQQAGMSYYSVTPNSGEAALAVAGTGGTGSLASSALEMSNVDLSNEFADIIVTQRGFQANSRLITVSDTMLEELINLKR